jgi:hypothetical protein
MPLLLSAHACKTQRASFLHNLLETSRESLHQFALMSRRSNVPLRPISFPGLKLRGVLRCPLQPSSESIHRATRKSLNAVVLTPFSSDNDNMQQSNCIILNKFCRTPLIKSFLRTWARVAKMAPLEQRKTR